MSPIDAYVTREELHFRRIDMRGYRRSDGLFEVEGRVTDRKPHDFVPRSGGREVPAGEPVHDMGVRLMELLIPTATTAFQSLSALGLTRVDRLDVTGRPIKIDSCYAYGAQRELVRRMWPEYYRPPQEE